MHFPPPTTSGASADDAAILLGYARMLQREALAGTCQPWLRAKNIGVFGRAESGDEDALFCRAAMELGATVARVRPFAEGSLATRDIEHTARLIGRLYDAIDWPRAPADLAQRVRATAGIPVYDGLAAAGHPTARLAHLLGSEASMADRRRFVVQAVLLATIM